jgi:hypothetical protein
MDETFENAGDAKPRVDEEAFRVFHRTPFAEQISEVGFRDATGNYLTSNQYTGVWVSDIALDINEGASGDGLFVVEIPEAVLTPYEWIEEGKPYREWLVPATLLNACPRRLLSFEEELEL